MTSTLLFFLLQAFFVSTFFFAITSFFIAILRASVWCHRVLQKIGSHLLTVESKCASASASRVNTEQRQFASSRSCSAWGYSNEDPAYGLREPTSDRRNYFCTSCRINNNVVEDIFKLKLTRSWYSQGFKSKSLDNHNRFTTNEQCVEFYPKMMAVFE